MGEVPDWLACEPCNEGTSVDAKSVMVGFCDG